MTVVYSLLIRRGALTNGRVSFRACLRHATVRGALLALNPWFNSRGSYRQKNWIGTSCVLTFALLSVTVTRNV
jgi:hypothetical protein